MVRFFQADLNKQLREADRIKPPNNKNLNHPSENSWQLRIKGAYFSSYIFTPKNCFNVEF